MGIASQRTKNTTFSLLTFLQPTHSGLGDTCCELLSVLTMVLLLREWLARIVLIDKKGAGGVCGAYTEPLAKGDGDDATA